MVLRAGGDVHDLHRMRDRLRIEAQRPAMRGAPRERVVAGDMIANRDAVQVAGGLIQHTVDEQQLRAGQVEELRLRARDRRQRGGGGNPAEIRPAPRFLAVGGKVERHAAASA